MPGNPPREFPAREASQHHMREWPLTWQRERDLFTRSCPHGVAHPDPDDVVHLQGLGGASGAHECDGCCIAPWRDSR